MRWWVGLLVLAMAWACGGDPAGPSRPEVAGTYVLQELRFDPQGVLPEMDLLPRLAVTNVELVLAPTGEAQLRYMDPGTGLFTVADGVFSTPTAGVRIHFQAAGPLDRLLLSPRMTYTYQDEPPVLTFDGPAPDGVSRQRLIELVPEWSGEQLQSPVPGNLVVVFTGVGG
jgi:hypothetical protein